MSLSKLYVEGKLDVEIYTKLFASSLAIVKGGSKTSIRPQADNDRRSKIHAGYLRDRDFDFNPPENMAVPTVDSPKQDQPWGWRLNRHEIENYLIDPIVVNAKFGVPTEVWQQHLCEAGRKIRWYQVARWVVGHARSNLPPNYKLQTSPEDVDEMRLPQDLNEQPSLQWCRDTIREYLARVTGALNEECVEAQIVVRRNQFSDELLDDPLHVITWCSGKDLFAALSDAALQVTGTQGAQLLCNVVRNWVMVNPETFLGFFPELAALKQQICGTSSLGASNG
jgi:hypothetical protein